MSVGPAGVTRNVGGAQTVTKSGGWFGSSNGKANILRRAGPVLQTSATALPPLVRQVGPASRRTGG